MALQVKHCIKLAAAPLHCIGGSIDTAVKLIQCLVASNISVDNLNGLDFSPNKDRLCWAITYMSELFGNGYNK